MQNLSEVVRNATTEPRLIYNRDRLVAAVVSAETFEAFRAWRGRAEGRSLAERFADLRQIARSEGYVFESRLAVRLIAVYLSFSLARPT